jgi:hypothetical protein
VKTYCERCGTPIGEGALRFLVTVNVTADFDGTLPAEGGIEDLEAFMRKLDKEDPRKLEHDVFQSKAFLLCPACKNEFMKHPLGSAAPAEAEADDEGRVH